MLVKMNISQVLMVKLHMLILFLDQDPLEINQISLLKMICLVMILETKILLKQFKNKMNRKLQKM